MFVGVNKTSPRRELAIISHRKKKKKVRNGQGVGPIGMVGLDGSTVKRV